MVRFKNRWLLVELIPPSDDANGRFDVQENAGDSSSSQVYSAVKQSILTHFGDTGWGAVAPSLTIKYFSPRTNVCIIRVARDHHRLAWAGVTLMSAVDGRRYVPHVVHVSGTIKQVQLAAIRHNLEVVARLRARTRIPAADTDHFEDFLRRSTQEIGALQD